MTTLYTGGPGFEAGLQPGDTIVAVNGKPVKGFAKNAFMSSLDSPAYTLSVLRPGGLIDLRVQPKKYAELVATLKR